MTELQIGDQVQTVSSTGVVTYSEVRTFLEKKSNTITQYKSISTMNETLTLTGNHLLYARKGFVNKVNPIYADQLSIGDEIIVQRNDKVTPVKLINIHNLITQGAYVPLTKEGKIVVDGVLASCYPGTHHDLAHLTMTPMQRFSAMMEWIIGEDTGFPVYVSAARQLGIMFLPDGQFWSY